jgi:hypothetical protein
MATNYYHNQLELLKDKTTLNVQFTDYAGNKTKSMGVNGESIDTLINFLKGEKTRINKQILLNEKELMTEVLFKRDGSEIFAVMPYDICDRQGNMTTYAHVGQHSSCRPDYVKRCKNANKSEYAELKKELESIGYKLNVIKKISREKYIEKCIKAYPNILFNILNM